MVFHWYVCEAVVVVPEVPTPWSSPDFQTAWRHAFREQAITLLFCLCDLVSVYMAGALSREEHLHAYNDEDAEHAHEAGHGGVAIRPEGREAWIGEGDEGGGEEVDEGGCEEDAGAEVAGEEEEAVGDWKARKSADDEGKGAGCGVLVVCGDGMEFSGMYQGC